MEKMSNGVCCVSIQQFKLSLIFYFQKNNVEIIDNFI